MRLFWIVLACVLTPIFLVLNTFFFVLLVGDVFFAFGLAMFGLFLSAGIGAFANKRRGRSGAGWYLLAVLISPLLAGALVIIRRPLGYKACPYCAEPMREQAIVCLHCERELPALPSAA